MKQKSSTRIISALLSLVLLGAGICSCSRKNPNDTTVTDETSITDETSVTDETTVDEEDADWFTTTKLELATEYNVDDYDYLDSRVIGVDDDGYIVETIGQLKIVDGYEWEIIDYSDYERYYIDYYSWDGNKVSGICLNSAIANLGEVEGYMSASEFKDGQVVISYTIWDEDSDRITYKNYIDYKNGTCGEWELPHCIYAGSDIFTPGSYCDGFVDLGDCSLGKYWIYDETNDSFSCTLLLTSEDNETTYNLSDITSGCEFKNIDNVMKISDNKILVAASGDATHYYIINLDDLSIEDITNKSDFLADIKPWEITNIEGEGQFVFDIYNGVRQIDFDAYTISCVMSFEECNVDRSKLPGLFVLSVSDSTIILGGTTYEDPAKGVLTVYRFDKSDTNPNKEKTILKVTSLNGYSDIFWQSIYLYNEQSDTCFLVADDRYNVPLHLSDTCFDTFDEYKSEYAATTNEITEQLTSDILSGDGPDIILNASYQSELNSSEYLKDISYLVDDSTIYFTNFADALKTDGILYQIPLSVTTMGITAGDEFWGTATSIKSFIYSYGDKADSGEVIEAVPVMDGDADFAVISSVAISANSDNAVDAEDYVKLLLGDDMQYVCSDSGIYVPINRNALAMVGNDILTAYNEEATINLMSYTEEELLQYDLPCVLLDTTVIDFYADVIEQCSSCTSIDPSFLISIED